MKKTSLWWVSAVVLAFAGPVMAGDVFKADNTTPLNDAGSWLGGPAVPGAADTAVWDTAVTGANTVEIGGPLTWDALRVGTPGGTVTINGTARLTLDGGAATDIDMGSAARDLTFNAPVTLSVTQVLNVAAGRTLTFNGPTLVGATGTFQKNGAGTVVFAGTTTNSVASTYSAGQTVYSGTNRVTAVTTLQGGNVSLTGPFTSSSDVEVYNGSLLLDGPASALTLSGRIFAGRTTTASDGLIVVSNGTHTILSGNADSTSSFIGVSAARRGRLFVDGGSLSLKFLRLATNNKASSGGLTDEIRVRGGLLSVTDAGTIAFMMGTRHDNTATEASRSGLLEITGGRFEVPNGTTLISTDGGSNHVQTLNVTLGGGVLAVKKITVGSKANATKNFWFNGGVLQATNTAADAELIDGSDVGATYNVQARGLLVDSGSGSVRLSKNLVQDPASIGGGLYKLGSGTLTLGGAGSYTGPTVVSNGTLRLAGTLAVTNLFVAPGATLSLADGALARFAPTQLHIGSATQASRLEVEVAAGGPACDTLALPAGAWLQKVDVSLFQQGTRNPLARAGDFPIMTYTGPAPALGGLSWATPLFGFTCAFELDSAAKTVFARVRYAGLPGESFWVSPAGGAWATAANWSSMPADAAGTRLWFAQLATAPSTVTLDTPFTAGQLFFTNDQSYTIGGAGSLTLDNGAAAPALTVNRGAHTVALPLTPAASLTVNAAANASLTLGGAIGGGAGLIKQGSGDLLLTAANTYAGGTTLQNGILALVDGASVGSGPVSLAVSGGRFRSTGTAAVTVTNPIVLTVSGGALDAIAPMVLTGTIDWAPGQNTLNKYGVGELTFKGSANESGNNSIRLNVQTGTMRVSEGGSIVLNAIARDTLTMNVDSPSPRAFIVETGAVVVVGGITTGYSPSNTVQVNGGSLTLTGSGAEVALIRSATSGAIGTDRIIVDAGTFVTDADDWLDLGVRNGNAELIVNGGAATVGRLSLGVRADITFDSASAAHSRVEVNGGLLDVTGAWNWMGDINPSRWNRTFLNGGTLRLPATLNSVSAVTNRTELTLNGGTLALRGLGSNVGFATSLDNYLNGLKALYVDQGGAVIDTLGNTVTITQALERVGATAGGLIKRGAGTLTLTGPCAFTGTTAVEAGALRFASAVATTGLTLSANTAFSLRNGAFDSLTLTAATLAAGARLDLEVAPDSGDCDRIQLPAGAGVGPLVIALYNRGGAQTVTRAGTYPIFSYAGTPPDVSGWTLAPECFGATGVFVVNEGNQTIDVQVAYNPGQSVWQNSGAGDWSVAGNWWPQAPGAAGQVRFGNALTADATVNVDAPVSVSAMIFDHTYRYTLAGAAVSFAAGAPLTVAQGSHTLASPLTLDGDTVATLAPAASLRVTGQVTGGGSLTVDGGGLLTLDGTNATPTAVRGGSRLTVPGVDSLGGAALTLDNGDLTVGSSGTLASAVTLGAAGGTFRSALGQTLALDAAVTGAGGLTKAGAGTVTLGTAADGYTGTTFSDGGSLSVTEVPAGALALGRGTLAFTGTSGATAQAVTIASGTNAAVLRAEGDLTLSGPVSTLSGAFFKRGAGTVTFAGANSNQLGRFDSADQAGLASTGADGDGPAAGFGAFNVAQGRVILGAAGQTNTIAGRLLVGLNTTAGADAETAGELVIAGGTTVATGWIGIGRSNGTTVTAPGGRASRLLVQDGLLVADSLSMGGAAGFAGYTGRPVLEIQGGTCLLQNAVYVNEAAGGVSTVWVNGGTLQQTGSQQLRLGSTLGEGVLRVSAGMADIAKEVSLGANGAGSTGTVELAGGTLTANNIVKGNTSGFARVTFNGGVFRPRAVSGTLGGLDAAKIGALPAVIDTSLAGVYFLSQALSGADVTDGGLVKSGTGTLYVAGTMAYTGPTGVSNGVLKVSGALPGATALTVAPGARLALNNAAVKTVAVSGLTLGDAAETTPAELEFGVDSGSATNDQLAVNGALTAHHAAFRLYWQSSLTDNIVGNNRYALIRYTGADPDPAAFSVANPQYGKQYTFSVSGQTLWLEVAAAAAGAHVWSAAGGGDWSDSGKWASAPGAGEAGAGVRFDSAIAADAAVRLDQDTTLGLLYFNNTNVYTVAADGTSVMTLTNVAGPAVAQVEKGRHRITAPLALRGGLNVKPITGMGLTLAGAVSGTGDLVKMNGGDLVLGATNSFAGDLRLTSGTVILTNGATAGAGTLSFDADGSFLRAVGSAASVLANPVALRSSQAVVIVDPQARLALGGELQYQTTATLYKQGAGELTLTGRANATNDNYRISLYEGVTRIAAGSGYRFGNVIRDSVKMDNDNSRGRTLAIDAGARAVVSGIYMAYGTNAVVVDGALDFTGNYDAVCLRTWGPGVEDRFTVRPGGSVTMPQATWFNVGVRGPAALSVEGGQAQLGRVSLGYQNGGASYNGSYGRVNVTGGGVLDVTGSWNWNGDNSAGRDNAVAVGNGSPAGATLRLPPTTNAYAVGWTKLALDNGTLVMSGAGMQGVISNDYLYGLRQLYVSPAGGTFETAGNDVTLALPVGSDVPGGSLAKAGAGQLTLTQPLRWDGTVDVRGGTLSAALAAPARQSFPSNLLARYSFENGPLHDSSGNGRYGSLAGSALTLGPGTNGLSALWLAGNTTARVPYDAAMGDVTNFTFATWIWLDAYATDFKVQTFFTTRLNSDANGPYENMIRISGTGNKRIRYMGVGATGSWVSRDSTVDLPLSNWVHVAVAVSRQGVTIYQNGVQVCTPADPGNTFRFSPARSAGQPGFAFGAYSLSETAGMFQGRLDDIQVYSRALSQAEVQALIAGAPALPSLRVAENAVIALQGGAAEVRDFSGEGYVSGALTVRGRVSPGDSTNAPAGASLMADAVTFGTNTVYAWTWSPTLSDELQVGRLKVDGAGVLDFGRVAGDPVTGPFRTVLMRYDTIEGAANFANWTFANAGRTGFVASITAADHEVVLNFISARGTVLLLR